MDRVKPFFGCSSKRCAIWASFTLLFTIFTVHKAAFSPSKNKPTTAVGDPIIAPPVILFWTKFSGSLGLHGDKDPPNYFATCSINSCIPTFNRSLANAATAILFDMTEFKARDIPNQSGRSQNQYYVFTNFESVGNPTYVPSRHHLKELDARFSGFFNLTMTYRRDSDIFTDSYVKIYNASMTKQSLIPWNKRNGTLWMVSHCKTNSKREEYAAELFKYMPVEKIGHCSRRGARSPCPVSGCSDQFLSGFKFHLAFENSICKDYVTEKAYRPLNYNSIPIVLGGADYSTYLPPNSYINIEDFASPKHLAEYLQKVEKNDEEYQKYFKWKKTDSSWTPYEKNSIPDKDHSWWCELCRLANLKTEKKIVKSYEDIYEWWFQPDQCRKLKPKRGD